MKQPFLRETVNLSINLPANNNDFRRTIKIGSPYRQIWSHPKSVPLKKFRPKLAAKLGQARTKLGCQIWCTLPKFVIPNLRTKNIDYDTGGGLLSGWRYDA